MSTRRRPAACHVGDGVGAVSDGRQHEPLQIRQRMPVHFLNWGQAPIAPSAVFLPDGSSASTSSGNSRNKQRLEAQGQIRAATQSLDRARSSLRSCQTGSLLTSPTAEHSIPTGVAPRGVLRFGQVAVVRANRNPLSPFFNGERVRVRGGREIDVGLMPSNGSRLQAKFPARRRGFRTPRRCVRGLKVAHVFSRSMLLPPTLTLPPSRESATGRGDKSASRLRLGVDISGFENAASGARHFRPLIHRLRCWVMDGLAGAFTSPRRRRDWCGVRRRRLRRGRGRR